MLAKWSLGEASDRSVQVPEVYADPEFSKKARVVSENVGGPIDDVAPKMGETMERLIDPMEPQKMQEYNNKAHKYEGLSFQQVYHSSEGRTGRWWPVWLVCRTKKRLVDYLLVPASRWPVGGGVLVVCRCPRALDRRTPVTPQIKYLPQGDLLRFTLLPLLPPPEVHIVYVQR